jgi:small-conductance mechanosensitive channel
MEVFQLFTNPFTNLLPKLPEVLIDLVVGYLLIKFLVWFLDHTLRLTKLPKLKGIIVSLTKFGLWLLLILFVANTLGFNKLAIALSGTVLVLVFFLNNGLGPLIMDVSSGIFLCTDQDFRAGSLIRRGTGDNAYEAKVIEVDMRKVRLIDNEGHVHVIPNAVFDREEWVVVERKEVAASRVKQKAAEVIKNKLRK